MQRVFLELGPTAGSIAMEAVSLGGYWTHFGPSGWYVDAVTQGTWYDSDAHSTTGPALHTERPRRRYYEVVSAAAARRNERLARLAS